MAVFPSSLCSRVLEPSGACVVLRPGLHLQMVSCPVHHAAALPLGTPSAGAGVYFAALLSFASTSPQSPPGSLHLFVTVPMSVSAAAVA